MQPPACSGSGRVVLPTCPIERYWVISDKGSKRALQLVERHYSRQKPGTNQFCRPGDNLVLLGNDGKALWVSYRYHPSSRLKRTDGLNAWECTLFRNEGGRLSSDLIKEAVAITAKAWGIPEDGFVTYVNPKAIKSSNPGYCFQKAGFVRGGTSKRRGFVRLVLPASEMVRLAGDDCQLKLFDRLNQGNGIIKEVE